MTEPRDVLIRFRDVHKRFGSKVVFAGLDLDVMRGETLGIIGASGVGKSVLLKMLIGLVPTDAGSITFHGQELTNMNEREYRKVRARIGMLFQGSALFDSLTVGENVAYGLREQSSGKMPTAEMDARVATALELVGLPGTQPMTPSELSGGMKKRVALARCVAVRPEVVLYDEPTTGLDPINTNRIAQVIVAIARTLHLTSIVVTHDMQTVFTVSDRIALLHEGRVLVAASPTELRSSTDPRVRDFIEGSLTLDVARLAAAS